MPKKEVEDICMSVMIDDPKYRAILFSDGTKEAWLPRDLIEMEKQRDGTVIVTAPIWLLKEKELI